MNRENADGQAIGANHQHGRTARIEADHEAVRTGRTGQEGVDDPGAGAVQGQGSAGGRRMGANR